VPTPSALTTHLVPFPEGAELVPVVGCRPSQLPPAQRTAHHLPSLGAAGDTSTTALAMPLAMPMVPPAASGRSAGLTTGTATHQETPAPRSAGSTGNVKEKPVDR